MPRSKTSVRDEKLRLNAEPYDWNKDRLTDDEVKEFALGMHRNEIFTELHIAPQHRTPETFRMVFMGLSLVMSEFTPQEQGAYEKSPSPMVYARYQERGRDNTLPRSVNGYPIFWISHALGRDDVFRVEKKYNQITQAIEAT